VPFVTSTSFSSLSNARNFVKDEAEVVPIGCGGEACKTAGGGTGTGGAAGGGGGVTT